MKFKDLLNKDFVLLDGAMGTMLQQNGLAPGQPPELSSIVPMAPSKSTKSSFSKSLNFNSVLLYFNI